MNILEKNLMVLASAGSGKTFCLSDRIIGMAANGIEPETIVALTFTRKAAGEFGAAVLNKLADAADDPATSEELAARLSVNSLDATLLLEKVVANLPRLTLGTMDGFFAKIVRNFQYELGIVGGKFELLEGEIAESAKQQVIERVLSGGLNQELEEEFIAVFRRANVGQEGVQVFDALQKFIKDWHDEFLLNPKQIWGPSHLTHVAIEDWEKQKGALIEQLRRDIPNIPDQSPSHEKAYEKLLEGFQDHTVGSGHLNKATGFMPKILEVLGAGSSTKTIEFSFYKKQIVISGPAGEALHQLVNLAAECELAAAIVATQGTRQVIGAYDQILDRDLRKKGKLGFADVKKLMGEWVQTEDARLRREAVDFRLDARYRHWLLDEFQDTSRVEWTAISPLIDEALTDTDSKVFIVGDKKQAIYGFKGGDVRLFDEIQNRYEGNLKTETMAKSYRSCPEVLKLVNGVCGDLATMREIFGDATNRWAWEDHQSANHLLGPANAGHAAIEMVEKDDREARVIARLRSLKVGKKAMTCGVLLTSNNQVREWSDLFRREGYQVVEEGMREPAKDHPLGITIWQLLRWLANPADGFAIATLKMSPLTARFDDPSASELWHTIHQKISQSGYAGAITELFTPIRKDWSDFAEKRFEDLTAALHSADKNGISDSQEVAELIERLQLSQSPGVASIQVMTIHKAKGLGFDVVLLPEISTSKLPSLKHFKKIQTDEWILNTPAEWVRKLIPELSEAQKTWEEEQLYDAFCKLYVGLTRSKRGLYLFLETEAKPKAIDPSFRNWICTSLEIDREPGVNYEVGAGDWVDSLADIKMKPVVENLTLGKAVQKIRRKNASNHGSQALHDSAAADFGSAVHLAFEAIDWLDEGERQSAETEELEEVITHACESGAVKELLSRNGRSIDLFHEQKIEAITDGEWFSGIIDRLHLIKDEAEEIQAIEIIDFKTGTSGDVDELNQKYRSQMTAYRTAISAIYPTVLITAYLIAVETGEVIEVS